MDSIIWEMNSFEINNQQNVMNQINMQQNFQNIILTNENKIKELEEIIEQKDEQISNINLYLNIMMMYMNKKKNKVNNNEQQKNDIDKQISITLKFKNEEFNIKCFENEKTSILKEKCNNIKKGPLVLNFQPICPELTLKQNGVYNGSTIYAINEKKLIYNLVFENSNDISYTISLSEDCPLHIAILYYYICLDDPYYSNFIFKSKEKLIFSYIAKNLKTQESTSIGKIFINNISPKNIVYEVD